MHQFYQGQFFNFETVRILSTARYGGADVAEFLDAVGHIRENDAVGWHKAWSEQAQTAEEVAHEAQRHGHRVAARMAFLRASNYTRASAYMMTGEGSKSDPRVVPLLEKVTDLFGSAMKLSDGPVHVLQIPYEKGLSIPAYLHLPPPSCRLPGKIPIVINPVGADSLQEEIYYILPSAGPELGYAVLTFEGPGQGLTLHKHGISMRPDWEVVNGIVLDYLFEYAKENDDLDLDRIAVAGSSLGGYFALRSAADERIKACIAIDPLYDLWDFATRHVSPTFLNLWDKGWISDGFVDGVILLGTRFSFQMKWEIATTSRYMGVSTPTELLRAMKRYTLRQAKGSYLDQVKCPVLVTGAVNSLYFDVGDHTAMVFDGLKHNDKEVWVAAKPGEGSLQAKVGAFALCNQRVFEFLDKRFGMERNEAV
ncbi:Alpha/Beta hydrolase protein [Whalleya microplaca]|nr:Alpha/Beta hydrolase protein [Whalleya microplaca]